MVTANEGLHLEREVERFNQQVCQMTIYSLSSLIKKSGMSPLTASTILFSFVGA